MLYSWLVQTPISLLLGVFMAGRHRYRAVLAVFFFVPLLLSAAAIAVTFKALLDPNFGLGPGLHSDLLTQNWLGDPVLAMGVIIFIVSWQFIPFHSLIYQGAVRQIPLSLYEAAALDGAGPDAHFLQHHPASAEVHDHHLLDVDGRGLPDLLRPDLRADRRGSGRLHEGPRPGHVPARLRGQPDGSGQRDRGDPRPRGAGDRPGTAPAQRKLPTRVSWRGSEMATLLGDTLDEQTERVTQPAPQLFGPFVGETQLASRTGWVVLAGRRADPALLDRDHQLQGDERLLPAERVRSSDEPDPGQLPAGASRTTSCTTSSTASWSRSAPPCRPSYSP